MNTQSEPKPAKIVLRELADKFYQDAWDAKARGEKIGWCSSNFPQEIPSCMGVSVVYPENHAAAVAAKGGGRRMCEEAEADGYSNDICAYARISLSYAKLKECPELNMPQPDFLLCCTNICGQVRKLTDKPVIAAATHVHWDHVGGHRYFPEFCAHEREVGWLTGGFPLTPEQIKAFVVEGCNLPAGFDVSGYKMFQGFPARVLRDGDTIDIGGRVVRVLHTPGHSPGHMCFWEEEKGYLFTGDLAYVGELFAYYPSTDPAAYLKSIERIAALPVKKVLPAHHDLNVPATILTDMQNAFRRLKAEGKLCHGSGKHDYGYFSVWL